VPFVDPEELKAIVTRLDLEGFQVHFHAIGDAAIRQSLDAVEAARKQNGNRGNRHHISHIQLFDPSDIPRFRQLGVAANFQPLWAYADEYITDLTIPFLGPERSRWLYPIRSMLDSGAIVAFGSDWNVSSANPFEEMEVAITRMGPNGETDTPFLSEERIDLASALAAFTINAAYVNGLESQTGSLEVGKSADLIVVDRNPFDVAPAELSELQVQLTLLEGVPVHGDWSF
jgi:predicted amidohydrolase YtcJ